MAASGRYRLPSRPVLDNWSTREKLALACSVMRSGDQNWVSVSRTIKAYAETERPETWFAQKNCAAQYTDLLEKVETPKRKRGDKEKETTAHVETPGNTIVSRLTVDRIEELQTLVREAQDKYRKLKLEIEEINAGKHDDKLEEMWAEMQRSKAAETVVEQDEKETNVDVVHTDTQDTEILEDCISPLPVLPPDVLEAALELQSPSLSDLLQKSPGDPNSLCHIDVSTVLGESMKDEPVDVEAVEETPVQTTVEVPAAPEVASSDTVPTQVEETVVVETTDVKVEPEPTNQVVEVKEEVVEETVQETPSSPKDNKQNEVQVEVKVEEDDKESTADVFPDTPVAAVETEEAPPSSPSSVISADTDGGSSTRGKGQRGGHRRSSTGRSRGRPRNRGSRSSRKATEEEKDVDISSKAESSDEDDESKAEESDTASTVHGRSLLSESMPNSPASNFGSSFSSEEEEKAHKIWKKSIMLVWRAAANHKYANVFLHPVTDDIAPGYRSVVLRPMNLMMIKKNIESGVIKMTAEFQRDMMLMFTNAIMYNNRDHDVFNMATEMYNDVMLHIDQYVLTQQMITKESGMKSTPVRNRRSDQEPAESGGKSLRGRRSEAPTPGASSDKEEEKKKRTSLEPSEHSYGGKVKKRKI